MFKKIAIFKAVAVCITTLGLAACSSSTETTGSGGSGSSALIVPNIDFGTVAPMDTYDTLIPITNGGDASITITGNGTSGEAHDTNFPRGLLLSPRGYQLLHVQFVAKDTGLRTAYDSIHYYQSTGGSGTALLKMTAHVSSSAPGGGGTVVNPGPGSSYTYDSWAVDTNGNSGTHADSTFTIMSNSLSYQSKTNVIQVREPSGDISYYHMEANGDLSIFLDLASGGLPAPSQWFTIPLGSHKSKTVPLYDTTTQGFEVKIEAVSAYAGPSSIAANGKTFATDQGSLAIVTTITVAGLFTQTQSHIVSIWFAKQLGFYAKRTDVDSTPSGLTGPAVTSSTNYVLKTYSIK